MSLKSGFNEGALLERSGIDRQRPYHEDAFSHGPVREIILGALLGKRSDADLELRAVGHRG